MDAIGNTFGNVVSYQRDVTNVGMGGALNHQYYRSLASTLTSIGWNNAPIDIQPPYFALAYIMKL